MVENLVLTNDLAKKMINRLLIIIFSFLIYSRVYGLSEPIEIKNTSKNSVYIELFGNAGYLYNITYDRIIFTKEKNNISAGLGVQYFSSSDIEDFIFSLSPQISYFYGIKHHFETGLGVAYDFNSGDFVIPIRIGYRFQKPEGGLLCKIGFTPLLTNSYSIFGEGFSLIPWGGLAIGWTF